MFPECLDASLAEPPHSEPLSVIYDADDDDDLQLAQLSRPYELQQSAFKLYCPRPIYPIDHYNTPTLTPFRSGYRTPVSAPFLSTDSSPFAPVNKNDAYRTPPFSVNEFLGRIALSVIQRKCSEASLFNRMFNCRSTVKIEVEEEEDTKDVMALRYSWISHYKSQTDYTTRAHYLEKGVCSICEDRASGLHYGITTCEGCKGFFKRTVQNKRIYACVQTDSPGRCSIVRERRNRCQYCRFCRCLAEGMVLEAVREDRSPGGRNGAAIYNSYHQNRRRKLASRSESSSSPPSSPPSVVVAPCHSSDDLPIPDERRTQHLGTTKNLIEDMIEIDCIDRLINLKGLRVITAKESDANGPCHRLSRIGDEIVEQLVEWTKLLPFFTELPIDVHTHLLTQRWAELVLLSACFYALSHSNPQPAPPTAEDAVTTTTEDDEISLVDASVNLRILQRRLSTVMGKEIPLDHVEREAGSLVDKFTALLYTFSRLNLNIDAYVCLKAITLLNFTPPASGVSLMRESHIRKVRAIQDQFVKALQIQLIGEKDGGARLSDILTWLPLLHSAASVLLHSKMFYVPFLICKTPQPLPDL
ncbi:hypothetical protein PMAYCL1PPCAC_01373 [Pristionchus mayeri]|uniref:Nuclear receptor n=1 Tax=Pristionchus mayeri TaxID=1317129 RepID=A0AAN4YZC4_9BILA|nr:hypothetical protein PMAYCL1PPCAC_01373 [Pristionchus mayeri]